MMIVAGVLRAGPPWRLVVPRSVQRPAVGVRHHSFLPRFVTAASPIVSTRRRPRPTPIAVLVRGHSHGHGPAGDAGHGHSHAHGADLIDRSSAEGTRITIIGLASNVALTVGKGAGGILWGSASLLADAVHSLLDLVSDFVTLFTFRKARADRDERFPYGYGKLEPLGALSISGILLFGGLGTGYHSFELLRALILSNDGPSASGLEHSAMLVDPHLSMLALAAIVGSIVVKEVLFWTTMAVAKKTKSDVLVANAWHHRADSVTSLVALCGIGGAVAGFPFLDPIGGILVSGMIVQASLQVLLPSIRELSDSAPKDTLDRVKEIVAAMQDHDKNILGFNTVRGRKMGPDYLVDLQLQVSPRITVSQSHQIAENVRHAITTKISGISEVLIHVDVEEHDHHVEDAVATKKPTSEIEEEIIRHAMYGLEHEVHEVSHLSVHFLNGGMEVTAEIILERENEISLRDASAIAHKIEDRILQFPGVLSADVHLETTEDMREASLDGVCLCQVISGRAFHSPPDSTTMMAARTTDDVDVARASMTGVGAGLSSATLADEVGGTAPRAAELKAYTIPTLLDTIYAAKDLPPLPSVETAVISPRHLRPPDVNPSTAPCLITLPYELLELIASHLPPLQILRLRTLSRLAYTRCTFPSVPFATLSIARSIHEDSHRLPRLSARAIRYMKSRGAKPSGFFGLPMPCSGRVRDVVEFRKLPVSYAVSHLMSTGGLREAGMMTMGVYMTIGCSAEEARKSGWAFGMDVIRAYVGHPAAVAMDKGKELEMRVYEWVAAMDDLQLFENLMEVYSNSPVGALETAAKAGAEKIIGKVFERKGAGMPMCKGQVIPAHVARSALQAALSEGHVGIVKAIRRSYGAWIFSGVGPAGLESIMMDATSSGKVECFQELLDMSFRFVKPYTAAVAQQAAVAFHWPIVSFLWEHCQPTIRTTACRAATINGTTHTNAVTWDNLLILAAESGQDDLVRSMLSPDSKILLDPKAMNSKALSVACENGHLICAQLLLDAGADPTASHNCAVRWSAANGQAATVKLLISCDKGVDLTAEKQFAVEFAARFGRTEVLRLLLTQPEVDPSSGDGETLCAAAERGHVEAIRLLLSSGKVEPDCQNNRPLRDAISGGFADAARVLMDAMPRVDVASVCGDDVLVQAARMGHEGVVAFLLEKDVTRHAKEALSAAIEAGYSTVGTGTGAAGIVRAILAKVNVREVEGLRLIRKAVREGKADVVNALAERFDVSDKMLRWAWRVAGSALDAPMLRWILDRVRPRVAAASERTGALRLLKGGNPLRPSRDGCDGNPGLMLRMSRTRWRFDGDERRLTPLYHATRACNLEVVQLLIEGGENAHVRRGELLAVAAASQAPKVVELLLEHGLVPDGARGDGHSALVWCLNMGMTAAVKALLEKGATVQFNDCEAIKAALLKGDEDMLEVLLDHVGA